MATPAPTLLQGTYTVAYDQFLSNQCGYSELPPDEEWVITPVDADTFTLYVGPSYPTMTLSRDQGRFVANYSMVVSPDGICQLLHTIAVAIVPTGGAALNGRIDESFAYASGDCSATWPNAPCVTSYAISLVL
jgi:hypothetical protein